MNHLRRPLLIGLFLLLASAASAVDNLYLKVVDAKGQARILCLPDGSLKVSNLAPGTYTMFTCQKDGQDLPANQFGGCAVECPADIAAEKPVVIAEQKSVPKDAPKRLTVDKEDSQGNVSKVTFTIHAPNTLVELTCNITTLLQTPPEKKDPAPTE